MSRTVHVAITDHGACSGATSHGVAFGGGRTLRWKDPDEGDVVPPYKDPDPGDVVPPYKDPDAGDVVPPYKDPDPGDVVPPYKDPDPGDVVPPYKDPRHTVHTTHGAALGGYGGCVPCGCGGIPGAPATGTAATAAAVTPDYSGWVIVRLGEDHAEGNFPNLVDFANGTKPELLGLLEALRLEEEDEDDDEDETGQDNTDAPGGEELAPVGGDATGRGGRRGAGDGSRPMPSGYLPSQPLIFGQTCAKDAEIRADLGELEKRLVGGWPKPGPSLLRYWRIDCREHPDQVAPLLAALAALPYVDIAYRELLASDPATAYGGSAAFGAGQGYLEDAPLGIGARAAQRHLPAGVERVRVVDLEQRWVLGHEELKAFSVQAPIFGNNRFTSSGDGNHGTAVLAQLMSGGSGTEGIASSGVHSLGVVSHWHEPTKSNGHVANAIVHALASQLRPGDVLLLEVERSGGPTELDVADATAVQLAVASGVTVIEAAGNGGLDLDAQLDFRGRPVLRRGASGFRETGAVLVGAAWSTLPHDRASFSSYGSRVDCYGWGDSVTTAGYGDLDPGDYTPQTMYTATFSGTSSAVPCVAGAAILLQAIQVGRTEQPLWPRRMREILADPATGTPQGPAVGGAIGVMPDLAAILAGGGCGIGPRLYLRRSIADDGDVCRDVTCSSPDVFALVAPPPTGGGNVQLPYPGDRDPVPGVSPLPAGETYLLFARAHNRGQGEATMRARFYTADVATLVWPDAWKRVAGVDHGPNVQQGDLPVLTQGLVWTPDAKEHPPTGHVAMLAVVTAAPAEVDDPLAKLRHCFDWAEYRRFLARPGVACRNTHQARARDRHRCLVTGTPDHARPFELQILQRLPPGTQVTLETTELLGSLLRRANPSLGRGTRGTKGRIELPGDPCLLFPDLRLHAGACFETFFTVTSNPNDPVKAGHRLVLRQLHRGHEVGRVTWYFTGP